MFSTNPTHDAIAQAAADAAYNATMDALAALTGEAHTAPAPVTPAPVAMTPTVAAQAAGTDGGANAFAAFRVAFGVPMSVWNAQAPKGSQERAQVRAAFGGGFDRQAHKGDGARALAAFGANVPAMQALAAAMLAAAGVPAAATQAAAAVAVPQAAPKQAPQALTLPGMTQAPQASTKPQPVGTVALNGLKRFCKSQGLTIPRKAADVQADTWQAITRHVEQERAQGHTVTADTVAAWLASVTQGR